MAASWKARTGPPNRIDISMSHGAHPTTTPAPTAPSRRQDDLRSTRIQTAIATASTTASVGRIKAIAAIVRNASIVPLG
jgi:hypothetical protein